MQIKSNKLILGGVSAEQLIKDFGSPLYVYEGDVIRDRINQLKSCIKWPKTDLHYACKANTNIHIMKILRKEGSYIDAVSPGEVQLALESSYDSKHILFTGNNASDEDLNFCIKNHVLVNLGSINQIHRYGKLAKNKKTAKKVSIRINPDVGAGHHGHCITGGPDSKFGVYYNEIEEAQKTAKKYGLEIIGIHSHIGSGILDTETWLMAMDVVLGVAKKVKGLSFIDFGGGIGVPYKPEEKSLNLNEFGKAVTKKFSEFCKEYGKDLRLKLEPGRFLVCESGYLLCTVTNTKKTPAHKFAGTDTGFNHLVRPAMYGSYHEIYNASNSKGAKEKIVIAGNICESGDIFTQDEHGPVGRSLPKIKEGDILAIANAGAYGYSMASNYNTRPLPAEVLVSKGKARVIRKRQKVEDLMKGM
ncbi:diaminopimelate decarboxylase [Nanoarchaeota archaeon]